MAKLCKWCGEPVNTAIYPLQPEDVCTGCWEIIILEEAEFLREKGIDLSEQITTAFAGSNSN